MDRVETRAGPTSYEILGRRVSMPCVVAEMDSYSASFLVAYGAARELIAYSGLEPAEPLPGKAMLALAQIKYLENDLGRYDEFAVALSVRHAGVTGGTRSDRIREFYTNATGTFIHRLPVSEAFTCQAGRQIWGFPKMVADAEIDDDGRRMRAEWVHDGKPIISMAMGTGGLQIPAGGRGFGMDAYSHLDGVTRRTEWGMEFDRVGVRFMTGIELELGTHEIAEELRALGIPRRPLMRVFGRKARATFSAPEVVET